MKERNLKEKKGVFTALSVFAVVALTLIGIPVLAMAEDERTGQPLPPNESVATMGLAGDPELAAAILAPKTAPFLVSTDMTGMMSQFEVYLASLQGFPIEGPSWALISTGQASGIAGLATTFYSYSTGGPSAPEWSHRGRLCYDIATLNLVLKVPHSATTLSFNWKFGTEENTTYTGTYRDTAKAIVTTSLGTTEILLLPDGAKTDVYTASFFSNPVTGSSASPQPPYPIPNDVVYNAVTGWASPNPNRIYTSTFDVTPFRSENITISFQIGDENDRVLDSAIFIDNLQMYPLNLPPVADAGDDQTVEQTSYQGTNVTLDGSGSSDPDGDTLTYTWTWPGGSATGVNPTVSLPLGMTMVTLSVYDGEYTDTDTVDITVQDTTPPTINVTANPNILWPPNHKMVNITLTVTANDICDADVSIVLESVVSNEPDDTIGDGKTINDIQGVDIGTADYNIFLRAERQGPETGRIYTITYTATDASNNKSSASTTVTVPHDQDK